MSPNLRIALRFLTAKKRAMAMSLSCVVLGVGLFVVTQATTTGFETFFIRTILGTDGAITIRDRIQDTMRSMAAAGEGSLFTVRQKEGRRYVDGIEEPKLVMDALAQFGDVTGASAVLTGPVTIRSSLGNDRVTVFGIDYDDHIRVSDLEHQITEGDASVFRGEASGALIGAEMAARLQLAPGDSFLLESNGDQRRYRVSAVYQTGVSEIDRTRLYLHMAEARSLLKRPIGASFIQVNLSNNDRAPEEAARMEEVLRHQARPWQVREESWLSAFSALKISSAITVSVFTLIAGLAMFNTLAMLVIEKTKEIAILRSMGYEREDITRIFLWQAAIVLAVGSLIGSLFGGVVTFALSHMPLPHGGISGIFATKYFLVDVSGWHYVGAILTAIVTVMFASLIPARRAARLEPGDVIRGTAL